MGTHKNPFTIRKIGQNSFFKKYKWVGASLAAVIFIAGLSSAFAATTATTVTSTTIFDPLINTSNPNYTQFESKPTNVSTGAGGNQPSLAPSSVSAVQPTFSGANIQGYIFNQKSTDATAQQNPVQVLDHMTVWGSINAHRDIYDSNGALNLNDDVYVGGKLYATGSAEISKTITAGQDSRLYVNNIDHVNDLNAGTEPVTIDHDTQIKGDLQVKSYIDSTTLKGGNIDVRGSIYKGTKNDSAGVSVEDPLVLNSDLHFNGTNKNIYGSPVFSGNGGNPAAVFKYGVLDVQGGLKNPISADNTGALLVDDDLRVTDNLIFEEPWVNNEGTALSWEPNYNWLHVGLDGGYDGNGLAAKNLWSNENIYAQGYIQNSGSNPVNIGDNLSVNGSIKANSIGSFYQKTSTSTSAVNSDLSISASCNSGDILVSCTSYTSGGGSYSRGNISNLDSCTGYGHTGNSGSVTVYATCFSPDG